MVEAEVIHVTDEYSDTYLASAVAQGLRMVCRRLGSTKLKGDGTIEVYSWNDSWFIAIVDSSDYTDIYAHEDLNKLCDFLIEEYSIDEEYDREAYTMLRSLPSK